MVAFDSLERTLLSTEKYRVVSVYSLEYSQIASHEVKPRQAVSIASLNRLGLTLPVIHARVDVTAS